MKLSDFIIKYNLDSTQLFRFLLNKKFPYNPGGLLSSPSIEDSDETRLLQLFKDYLIEEGIEQPQACEDAEKEEALAQAKEEMRRATSSMLITSGFQFDGYRITKYSGYISGDDTIQIARGTSGIFTSSATNVGDALTDSLVKIRRNALAELKEAAYLLGCNAVIGVDFDYITLEPETANIGGGTTYLPYVFCVTANGNAVVIEKTEE